MRVLLVDDERPAHKALANVLSARSDVEHFDSVNASWNRRRFPFHAHRPKETRSSNPMNSSLLADVNTANNFKITKTPEVLNALVL